MHVGDIWLPVVTYGELVSHLIHQLALPPQQIHLGSIDTCCNFSPVLAAV